MDLFTGIVMILSTGIVMTLTTGDIRVTFTECSCCLKSLSKRSEAGWQDVEYILEKWDISLILVISELCITVITYYIFYKPDLSGHL